MTQNPVDTAELWLWANYLRREGANGFYREKIAGEMESAAAELDSLRERVAALEAEIARHHRDFEKWENDAVRERQRAEAAEAEVERRDATLAAQSEDFGRLSDKLTHAYETIDTIAGERDAERRKREAVERDAERWRWARDPDNGDDEAWVELSLKGVPASRMDELVDAAIARSKGGGDE